MDKYFSTKNGSVNEVPLKLKRKIISLVGERPLIDLMLNGTECKGLWDTGSMISLMNIKFLTDKFPAVKIHSIEEFLGDVTLNLSAANNTDVPVEGVALLDFAVGKSALFKIPFLITKEAISNPIIGYNTIEHLVNNYKEL